MPDQNAATEWPASRQYALLVAMGAATLLIAFLFPYVEFEKPHFSDGVYPQGESFSVLNQLNRPFEMAVLAMLVLVGFFAFAYDRTRTKWPYRGMWLCVIFVTVENVQILLPVFRPGLIGYVAWWEMHGNWDMSLLDLKNPLVQDAVETWRQVTKLRLHTLVGLAVCNGTLLYGAWKIREIRRADRALLARHERSIIDHARNANTDKGED